MMVVLVRERTLRALLPQYEWYCSGVSSCFHASSVRTTRSGVTENISGCDGLGALGGGGSSEATWLQPPWAISVRTIRHVAVFIMAHRMQQASPTGKREQGRLLKSGAGIVGRRCMKGKAAGHRLRFPL